MRRLLFGPAGIPLSAGSKTTPAGILRVAELGLTCMEVQFVQGVRMGEQSALAMGGVAGRAGVTLSAHGPYAINLNSREPEKVEASKQRILRSARIASLFGGRSVVFHAAVYSGDAPSRVLDTVRRELSVVLQTMKAEGNHVRLRPELMGKSGQFGALEELLELCAGLEGVLPCIDFAHWHARTGKVNSYGEFISVLRQIEKGLGRVAIEDMHMHISGIAYTRRGEAKHLRLHDSDLKYEDLMRALKDYGVGGLAICESPTLEEDALLLQQVYSSLG